MLDVDKLDLNWDLNSQPLSEYVQAIAQPGDKLVPQDTLQYYPEVQEYIINKYKKLNIPFNPATDMQKILFTVIPVTPTTNNTNNNIMPKNIDPHQPLYLHIHQQEIVPYQPHQPEQRTIYWYDILNSIPVKVISAADNQLVLQVTADCQHKLISSSVLTVNQYDTIGLVPVPSGGYFMSLETSQGELDFTVQATLAPNPDINITEPLKVSTDHHHYHVIFNCNPEQLEQYPALYSIAEIDPDQPTNLSNLRETVTEGIFSVYPLDNRLYIGEESYDLQQTLQAITQNRIFIEREELD